LPRLLASESFGTKRKIAGKYKPPAIAMLRIVAAFSARIACGEDAGRIAQRRYASPESSPGTHTPNTDVNCVAC